MVIKVYPNIHVKTVYIKLDNENILPLYSCETKNIPCFLDKSYLSTGTITQKEWYPQRIYYQLIKNKLYELSNPTYAHETFDGFKNIQVLAELTDDEAIILQNNIDSYSENPMKFMLNSIESDTTMLCFDKDEIRSIPKYYEYNGFKLYVDYKMYLQTDDIFHLVHHDYKLCITSDEFRKLEKDKKVCCFECSDWSNIYAEVFAEDHIICGFESYTMDDFCEILDEFQLLFSLGLKGYYDHCNQMRLTGKSARN